MQTQLIIAGVKQFKGNVEGTDFDHCKLLIQMPFSKARAESNIGYDTVEAVYGKASNFSQFVGKKFPLVCMGEIEMALGSGGRQTIDVLEIQLPKAP